MNKPTQVVVGEHTFNIEWGVAADDIFGRTQLRQCVIQINDTANTAPSQVRDTLFHEILHAAFVGEIIPFAPDEEERVARVLAPTLLGILRHNPEVVQFLLEK